MPQRGCQALSPLARKGSSGFPRHTIASGSTCRAAAVRARTLWEPLRPDSRAGSCHDEPESSSAPTKLLESNVDIGNTKGTTQNVHVVVESQETLRRQQPLAHCHQSFDVWSSPCFFLFFLCLFCVLSLCFLVFGFLDRGWGRGAISEAQ